MAAENSAILLTAPGAAAIAVVRLDGPGVDDFLRQRFSAAVVAGRCMHGTLCGSDGAILDDPVVVRVAGAAIDLNLHGGVYVVRAVLELCRAEGFAVVDRLEAPLPAGAGDATDAIEMEVLQHLPAARTQLALRILLAQPAAWRELEASIAAGSASTEQLRRVLADRALHWLLALPRVAIIGPANVGKSTLANRLFNQERSITADVSGTTRDWVGEIANIAGLAVMLIDTPGHRRADEAVDPLERAALAASEPQIAAADLVILVLDRSAPMGEDAAALRAAYPNALLVASKADLPAAWDAEAVGAIPIVGTSGENVPALVAAIVERFHCEDLPIEAPRCWTERQRMYLRVCCDDSRGRYSAGAGGAD